MLRPNVLTIAGLDPSGGAGMLADIKCFEQHKVYGFGICTALTIQNDTAFFKAEWLDLQQLIDQLNPLMHKFHISACKVGLIKDLPLLAMLLEYLKRQQPHIKVVLDPILKASAGFEFHNWKMDDADLKSVLKNIDLITPNYLEMSSISNKKEILSAAREMAERCPVLLKGGHNAQMPGYDYLIKQDKVHELPPVLKGVYLKHGSGCVLSAAITANLALGNSYLDSCRKAKKYTELFLNSNDTNLGYHKR